MAVNHSLNSCLSSILRAPTKKGRNVNMSDLLEENRALKKEMQVLRGKLGAQGYKQTLEKKYRDLQTQLYEAYNQVEALEKEKRNLRDDFARSALKSIITKDKEYPERERAAIIAYGYADAMMKEREII